MSLTILKRLGYDCIALHCNFHLRDKESVRDELFSRTFAKLLSLPVDFYERIASGVLIKHMQQTEKIRSFLSGSLFFSALELLSLVVFLPFLLFYSVKLTFVVLAFTLAMALVIAVLIKPFQIRLEELYLERTGGAGAGKEAAE